MSSILRPVMWCVQWWWTMTGILTKTISVVTTHDLQPSHREQRANEDYSTKSLMDCLHHHTSFASSQFSSSPLTPLTEEDLQAAQLPASNTPHSLLHLLFFSILIICFCCSPVNCTFILHSTLLTYQMTFIPCPWCFILLQSVLKWLVGDASKTVYPPGQNIIYWEFMKK